MPVRYILSSVWITLSIFSQLSIMQCKGLCILNLPISLVMIERIYTLSYYHNQIGSVNYYPLFRVRSWNNGMRFMSLYILSDVIEREYWYTPYVWKKHHVNCPHFNINVSKISFCWSHTWTETKCAACMTRIIMSKAANGLWKGIWFRH